MTRADQLLIMLAAGWTVPQLVALRARASYMPDEQAEAARDERERWQRGRREILWMLWLARLYDQGAFDRRAA